MRRPISLLDLECIKPDTLEKGERIPIVPPFFFYRYFHRS